jgi:hypothetical protein
MKTSTLVWIIAGVIIAILAYKSGSTAGSNAGWLQGTQDQATADGDFDNSGS